MTVGLVGSGPAGAAVEAALSDVEASVAERAPGALDDVEVAVVVGQAGDAVFEQVNETALAADVPWFAVELGGLGGYPVVDAAVSGFHTDGPCYECLSGRVAANLDPQADPVAAPPAHTARYAGAVAGRQVARFLADGALDGFGRVTEVPHAERRVLPLPDCVCATPVDSALPLEHGERDLQEALALAEQGLDPRVGIVQDVGEAESFPVPYYLAHACDTAGFSDATAARDAAGVAPGWDAAFMKALGEALERYCAGVYRVGSLASALPGDLADAVPPSAFVTRSDPDPSEPLPWAAGQDLASGDEVHLPAEFAYYPPPAEQFRPAVTTGLGLGSSGVEAVLAGLYEVIERDAAMLAWYSTFDPLELEVEGGAVGDLVARARSEDLEVTLLLLTQDVDVPVVAAAVQRDTWPTLALGAAADLDATAAAESALAEALQNWMELRGMGPEDAETAGGRIGQYAQTPGPAADFVDADTTTALHSVGAEDPATGADALDELIDRLDEADLTPYAVRTTTRDVAAMGFEAVRVLVPAAQPLFFEDAYFGDRADAVPDSLGFEARLDRDHHPFP